MRLPAKFETFNRLRGINRWLQILLLLALLAAVNLVAIQSWQRWDLSDRKVYSLVPESVAYLGELPQAVEIFVTIPAQSPRRDEQILHRYTSRILREFAYHSRRRGESMVRVEFVDLYKDLSRAAALFQQFRLDQPNAVLVVSGNRQRLLRAEDLIVIENQRPVRFKGEAAILSAVVEVTAESVPVLYFLQGHGETLPDDTHAASGLSNLSRELQLRNHLIRPLDLARSGQIPADAAAVVIAHPKGPLRRSEVEQLRSYLLEDAGRLLLWLSPGIDHGLEPLLKDWGIHLPNRQIIENQPSYRDASGALLIRNLGQHAITSSLIQQQNLVLAGHARPVLQLAAPIVDERLEQVALLGSSANSWASPWPAAANIAFDADRDLRGPLPIAVAAERRAPSHLGLRVLGGRIAVFGSAELFGNEYIQSAGNLALFFNTVDWLLDRERVLAIPERAMDTYQVAVSEAQLARIALLFLLAPGAIALLGAIVHWTRR